MTKKLLGLLVVALFCSLTIHASGLDVLCSPAGAQSPAITSPGQPTFTQTFTCGSGLASILAANPGDYISQLDYTIADNTFNGGTVGGTQTLIFSYTAPTGFNGGTSVSDTVTGGSQSLSGTLSTGACTTSDNGLGFDCESTTDGSPQSTTPFNITATSSWITGSLQANGDDQVNVYYSYTLTPIVSTPEPASLLMIGGGLIGLASLLRRKKA